MSTVAGKHDLSVANVATRYVLEQEAVGSVIVGVRNTEHLDENLKAFSFALDESEKSTLQKVESSGYLFCLALLM